MIKDDKITLRAPEEGDVDRLFLWENDPSMFEAVANPAPVSRYQVWEYIKGYKADPYADGQLRLMIDDGSGTVGHIDLYDVNAVERRAAVAVYIEEDFRRRGHATAALELLKGYASTTLGLHQLWAQVAVDNAASTALFRRCGFRPAGKLRSWIRRGFQYADALMFQHLFS